MGIFGLSGGAAIGLLGAGLAVCVSCVGSANGTGLVGEAAAGLMCEETDKFGKAMILQVIPGTHGLFGLVVGFLCLMRMGVFAGTLGTIELAQGFRYLAACLPVAIGCGVTAKAQGRVAAGAINILALCPNDWAKGIVLCITVEFYSILSLLISLLMLINI